MSSRMSLRVSSGESGLRILPSQFRNKVQQLADETVESLQRIWEEAGYEETDRHRLLGDLLNKLKITCANELAAEQQILEHAKQEVAANVAELASMNEQLGRQTNLDYLLKMNYTDKLAELERIMAALDTEVSQRQQLLDKEWATIQQLCEELGEAQPVLQNFRGPQGTPMLSDVRLDLMRSFKSEMEMLRLKNVDEIKALARECHQHMADLMYAEEGFCQMDNSELHQQLDKSIVQFVKHNEFSLGASKATIAALQSRTKDFLKEKDRRREELAQTGDEIARLWSLLRIPSVEREQFQNSFEKNLSMATLRRGYEEMQRLRDVRKRSLGRVVSCIRSDINALWEEVGIVDDDQRLREFPPYFQDLSQVEDSSADEHELYFSTLRVKVEELKPIFLKIGRREIIVQERIELEHLQLNPERLTARGPNAREERKREEGMTMRVKGLEKLTKELVSQIQVWEENNQKPFIHLGERYLERITRQEENYIEIRDTLRNARKRKDANATVPAGKTMTTSMKKTVTVNGGTPFKLRTQADMAALTPTSTPAAATFLAVNNANKAREYVPIQSYHGLPAPAKLSNRDNSENQPPSLLNTATESREPVVAIDNAVLRKSRDSEETLDTQMTSATVMKDRNSGDSVTIVQEK